MVSSEEHQLPRTMLNYRIGPKNATVVTTSATVLLATPSLAISAPTLALVTVSCSVPINIIELLELNTSHRIRNLWWSSTSHFAPVQP